MIKTKVMLNKATATQTTEPLELNGHYKTFHAYGKVSASTGSAAIDILASNDGVEFTTIDTLSLTLGTSVTHDTFENSFGWKFIKANLKTLTGTDAEVTLTMGVEG